MTETKEERPPSSAGGGSQTQQDNDVANLNSLATLNLLHQQLMQLRASVNQFLYPLSKPDTHSSGCPKPHFLSLTVASSVADSFAENAQQSSDLLKSFSGNHRRHKGVFDYVNEKYEANSKGLLPYRTPTADEQAMTAMASPVRKESLVRQVMNPPPAIEHHEDGLSDITQIHKDWDTFKQQYDNITCEKLSDLDFTIKFPKPVQFLSLQITLTPLRSNPNSYSLAISPQSPPTSDLDTSILKELSQHKTPKSFLDFLTLIASYESIFSEQCHSCNRLIGVSTGDLPTLRRWTGSSWGAWHKSC